MKATIKSLCSSVAALAFVASLALSGCSAGLAGPDAPPAAPPKANTETPAGEAPHMNGSGNGGGSTTHTADHNEVPEMR